jgi:hypothetical protein
MLPDIFKSLKVKAGYTNDEISCPAGNQAKLTADGKCTGGNRNTSFVGRKHLL